MKFSTRVEYGLRAISRLDGKQLECRSLRQIAKDENISLQYLERIFNILKKKGIVDAEKGATGGYYLARKPKDISVLEVIEALDGPINPFRCVSEKTACSVGCQVSPVWRQLYGQMSRTLGGIRLSKLLKE